jgi:hypothetical protein
MARRDGGDDSLFFFATRHMTFSLFPSGSSSGAIDLGDD